MGSKRKRSSHDEALNAHSLKKHLKTQPQSATNQIPRPDSTNSKPKSRPKSKQTPPKTPTPASQWRGLFVTKPRGTEQRAEVDLYNQLASEVTEDLGEAAVAIVTALLGTEGEDDEEDGDERGRKVVSEEIMIRHLLKLIRGLASGRKNARKGYGVVLAEILSQLFGPSRLAERRYPNLTFEWAYTTLLEKTKPSGADGAVTGQEERDHAIGLEFGLLSMVQAKIVFGHGSRWEEILNDLLKLADTKMVLRAPCGKVIVGALDHMNQKEAEFTLEKVQKAGLAASPEGVAIWLVARKRFPDMKFPNKPWGSNGKPLEHLQTLAKALKESSSSTGNKKENEAKPTGHWDPNLHFAWEIVLDPYISTDTAKDDGDLAGFDNFWKVVVDENLFSESASNERKAWGFLVFQKMLRSGPACLSKIFSPNLMRCLINHISKEDRLLHMAAEKSLRVLRASVEEDVSRAIPILSGIIGTNGAYNFDQVTKTKTIDKILHSISGSNAVSAISTLREPVEVVKTSDPVKDAESRRQMYGDYILTIIRRQNLMESSDEARVLNRIALPELASLAYSVQEGFRPELSDKSRTIFRNRLTSTFAHLISDPIEASWIAQVITKTIPDAVDMDKEIETAAEQAQKTLAKLIKKSNKVQDTENKSYQAISLLYALVIFQLYNGEADAVTVLDELKICYDKLIRGKGAESDAEASVVLVEMLLSFMSKPSALLRKAAQQVFTAFSAEVTEEGLRLMIDVLQSGESLKGQQELFDQNDEEEGGETDDVDEDELNSDVEVIHVNGAAGDSDSSDDEENEGEEEDNKDDEESHKLDEALAKALGTHRADQDLNEELSGSDEDMDDSEMEELGFDSKLVEIFSQRKNQPNKKKEAKDARENIVNFKTRVLDLLEIYVKRQARSPFAFDLLIPLLNLMRTSTAKQLKEKAHSVISTLSKAFKGLKSIDGGAPFDLKSRINLLKEIHLEASRSSSHALVRASSSSSLLVSMSLLRANKDSLEKVQKVYNETRSRWATANGELKKVQYSFFVDELQWLLQINSSQ